MASASLGPGPDQWEGEVCRCRQEAVVETGPGAGELSRRLALAGTTPRHPGPSPGPATRCRIADRKTRMSI